MGYRLFIGYKNIRNSYPIFSKLKSGKRLIVAKVKVIGNIESDKLIEWH